MTWQNREAGGMVKGLWWRRVRFSLSEVQGEAPTLRRHPERHGLKPLHQQVHRPERAGHRQAADRPSQRDHHAASSVTAAEKTIQPPRLRTSLKRTRFGAVGLFGWGRVASMAGDLAGQDDGASHPSVSVGVKFLRSPCDARNALFSWTRLR